MLGYEPCWVFPFQEVPKLSGNKAVFSMRNGQGAKVQNANVFEFEAVPEAKVVLLLNGEKVESTVGELCEGSRIVWFKEECKVHIKRLVGVEIPEGERDDPYYHLSRKAKLHRVIPRAGFTAEFEVVDDEPLSRETNYRVRVEQRNGQRAWSSPVWVKAPEE